MAGNVFRNYAAALTSPTAWIGILLILGIMLLWLNRAKAGKITVTLATVLFVMFSFDPLPEFLLNSFENLYPGLKVQNLKQKEQIKHVVVLAGGHSPHPQGLHPITTEVTRHTLPRLIEGIRIYRELPGSKLIFTGKGWSERTEAETMKEMALKLGVPADDIILENESINTFSHTENLKPFVGTEPFILVTSAFHMPRAMGLFQKAGYKPIPAPSGHLLTGEYKLFNMKVPFARGDNLDAMDLWFVEFSAIMLGKMRGRI